MDQWIRPGDGLKDTLIACRKLWNERNFAGYVEEKLSQVCDDFDIFEIGAVHKYLVELEDSAGWYDIGHPRYDPFPNPSMHGYLTEEYVLSALGVPVNYTQMSLPVNEDFANSHDVVGTQLLDAVGYLLDSGIKVAMVYGDRDYACNWVGGEKASLAVPYNRSNEFANTGYSQLLTTGSALSSGMTRQLGNFSFTRVFQAGHEVPSYQPIAAYEIFMRTTFNRDVATGLLSVTDDYSTIGPQDTCHIKNIPPSPKPLPKCYIPKPETCVPEIWEKVKNGTAVVKDWFVIDEDGLESAVGRYDSWFSSDSAQVIIDEFS